MEHNWKFENGAGTYELLPDNAKSQSTDKIVHEIITIPEDFVHQFPPHIATR